MATTTYVIVASLQVFLLFAFWTPSGTVWWRAQGATLWVVSCLYAAPGCCCSRRSGTRGWRFRPAFSAGGPIFGDRAPVFPPMPTTGLFRFVRQPIYVAFALTLWTVPTWTPDQLVDRGRPDRLLPGRPAAEGGALQAAVRRAISWRTARRVPYWLPGLAAGGPPQRPVDLRRLLRTGGATTRAGCGRSGTWCRRALRSSIRSSATGQASGCSTSAAAAASWRRPWRRAAPGHRHRPLGGGDRGGASHAASTGWRSTISWGRARPSVRRRRVRHRRLRRRARTHRSLGAVVSEIRRVLRPGGLFLFDTINRNPLASFVMVTIGERSSGLLPPGTHDPAMFIRPSELGRSLERNGFVVGRFAGFGPRRLNGRLDLTFGRWPTTAVQYLGHAQVAGTMGHLAAPPKPHR